MDFLDPQKRRSHRMRLMIGYGLVAVAIGLATTILVYGAYGYGIDTKTGNIVQNGLLFVDSKPGNAGIYIDDKYQNRDTAARLIMPARSYKLTLKKDGYRNWQRQFTLSEHTVSRFVYPFLFPERPVSSTLKTYSSKPGLVSSSPDRRWLLVQNPATSAAPAVFDEFDTSRLEKVPRPLSIPRTVLTGSGSFTEIEWSSDNNYLLLRHNFSGGYEFILLDRREPAKTINLNRLFQTAPTEVLLHNKKTDRVYIFDQPSKTLRRGIINSAQLEPILISQLLAFKPYGNDLISYVVDKPNSPGQASVYIWDEGKTYLLSSFPASENYLIDAAQFQNQWYYVVGSNASDRIRIYKNPLNDLKSQSTTMAAPVATLRLEAAREIKFSENTRFVGLQAGQKFAVYDFEEKERYQYTVSQPLTAPMKWMDGHRFIGLSGGNVVTLDYDSTNPQTLWPALLEGGGYFNNDFNLMFTLVPGPGTGVSLQSVDMRAGGDLPR